jgi:hypothetical protein
MSSTEPTQPTPAQPGGAPPAQPGGGPPFPRLPFPLPPTFPEGVDPATYRLGEVTELLRRASYFSLFSVHNPDIPNKPLPVPGDPQGLAGIEVNENTHRFQIHVDLPHQGRLTAGNVLGEVAAHVHIDWLVIPEDFQAAPGHPSPPTPLDLAAQQRFTMMNGSCDFVDRDGSGFHGFGAGRTFPQLVGGQPRLVIGANIVMLEGLGRLAGLQACAVVNGYISPPQDLFISIMLRVMDPGDRLDSPWPLEPIQPQTNPDPDAVFMTFLGEQDPDRPTTLNVGSDGSLLGSNVHELLRLVDVGFDLGPADASLRARTRTGPVVGRLATQLFFNPLDPAHPGTASSPVPYWTRHGKLELFEEGERLLGALDVDVVEGRGFVSELPGAPMPVYRLVGFGPFLEGSGLFSGVSGMLSMNGAVSVFPRTLSNLYVLRIEDPEGRFRAAAPDGWC